MRFTPKGELHGNLLLSPLMAQDNTVVDANSGRSIKDKGKLYKPNGNTLQIGLRGGLAVPSGEFNDEPRY